MDPVNALRSFVRACVGLPDDPGKPPLIDRLAFYRAQVVSASSDGKTLDVKPEDTRISAHQQVPIRVGIPGATAVVTPGAVVMLGWDGGNPKLPYCVPHWESGATVTKLTFDAQVIELAGNSYSAPKWDDFLTAFSTFLTDLKADLTAGSSGGCTTTGPDSMLPFVAATYKSTKVKNG